MAKSGTRRRPDDLRAQILATAEAMFREKGLAGTTAEEIAAEAGVARSVLYRHFDGKAELVGEVFRAGKIGRASCRERVLTDV